VKDEIAPKSAFRNETETVPAKTDGLEQLAQQESEQLIDLDNHIETRAQSLEASAKNVSGGGGSR